MATSEDERLAVLLRAIRRRAGLRQADLAAAADVPRGDVVRIEAGRAGQVALDRIRRVTDAAGARFITSTWWRGAAADRLLDERHAALVERVVGILRSRGWHTDAEVSFSEYGERGSIDVFAGLERAGALAVCEVKGSFGSLEEMNRSLDVKARLAPKLARDRLGWSPRVVGRLLILPDDSTMRRIVDRHAETMSAIYPARSREVRAWLRAPVTPLRGIWFLSDVRHSDTNPT